MADHLVPSLRPVLFGSLALLMSVACSRSEHPQANDTSGTLQDTTGSQSSRAPSSLETAREQERLERIHVTGRDIDPGLLERERLEQERRERIHVTGRDGKLQAGVDEDLQDNEGTGAGTAGSGGGRSR